MKKTLLVAGMLALLSCSAASANCHPGHVEDGKTHDHASAAAKSLNDMGKDFSSMLEAASAVTGRLGSIMQQGPGADAMKTASRVAAELSEAMEELSTVMFLGSAEEKDLNELRARFTAIRSTAEALTAGAR